MLSCKYVDDVFPENNWEQKRSDIIKYGASIFGIVMLEREIDDLSDICEVIYLERTESVSTTDIKKELSKISSQECEQLESISSCSIEHH